MQSEVNRCMMSSNYFLCMTKRQIAYGVCFLYFMTKKW